MHYSDPACFSTLCCSSTTTLVYNSYLFLILAFILSTVLSVHIVKADVQLFVVKVEER